VSWKVRTLATSSFPETGTTLSRADSACQEKSYSSCAMLPKVPRAGCGSPALLQGKRNSVFGIRSVRGGALLGVFFGGLLFCRRRSARRGCTRRSIARRRGGARCGASCGAPRRAASPVAAALPAGVALAIFRFRQTNIVPKSASAAAPHFQTPQRGR